MTPIFDWSFALEILPTLASALVITIQATVLGMLVAVTLGLVLSLVYYPLATAGAVLDRPGYERLRVGDPRDGLGLPRRQVEPPDGDTADGCEYYTDGNFPFAEPTWRLCFTEGRLASKEQIAR